jgi:hypothetical protein
MIHSLRLPQLKKRKGDVKTPPALLTLKNYIAKNLIPKLTGCWFIPEVLSNMLVS